MYRLNSNFENIFMTQDCYTRVLKGHIDIANSVFPNDTYGKKRWLTVFKNFFIGFMTITDNLKITIFL